VVAPGGRVPEEEEEAGALAPVLVTPCWARRPPTPRLRPNPARHSIVANLNALETFIALLLLAERDPPLDRTQTILT
jgi:hypothetical protein